MVVALREVAVRGEIHTILDYAVDMLQAREGGGRAGGCAGYGRAGVWTAGGALRGLPISTFVSKLEPLPAQTPSSNRATIL